MKYLLKFSFSKKKKELNKLRNNTSLKKNTQQNGKLARKKIEIIWLPKVFQIKNSYLLDPDFTLLFTVYYQKYFLRNKDTKSETLKKFLWMGYVKKVKILFY